MSTGKSKAGRDELTTRVQQALKELREQQLHTAQTLPTKKEAESIVNLVVLALEQTLLSNLDKNGFSLKLNSFGKFTIRHKSGIYRKIPFLRDPVTDECVMRMTNPKRKIKFISLGELRDQEVKKETK
jgi:nucleoid DNA-binding protein